MNASTSKSRENVYLDLIEEGPRSQVAHILIFKIVQQSISMSSSPPVTPSQLKKDQKHTNNHRITRRYNVMEDGKASRDHTPNDFEYDLQLHAQESAIHVSFVYR